VINMGQIPIAPINRIIKNSGGLRVSEDAEEALGKFLEECGEKISREAIKLAKHVGKTTVKELDIELANKTLHKIYFIIIIFYLICTQNSNNFSFN